MITAFGVGSASPEPAMSDSSPLISDGPIEYITAPVDRTMIDSYPQIRSGARQFTVTRPIVIDIKLTTPRRQEILARQLQGREHMQQLDELIQSTPEDAPRASKREKRANPKKELPPECSLTK